VTRGRMKHIRAFVKSSLHLDTNSRRRQVSRGVSRYETYSCVCEIFAATRQVSMCREAMNISQDTQ
ncbi:hypothetical protein M3C00_011065, partial [Micrococcus luteus]|nr:hypothetical protein [Micrococcus luteus]MCV7588935.1 hypothetical protein [Micrococcus luteus]